VKILLHHISGLLQVRESLNIPLRGEEMAELPYIDNAWLLLEDELISDYGSMDNPYDGHTDHSIDCTGRFVLPTWCDSHTHLVYAGNRESEFIDRINGLTYQEIAAKGGGILNSSGLLRATAQEDLYNQSEPRLLEVMEMGTGAIEIKSGYGLDKDSECKMLATARKLGQQHPVEVVTTFLGAHAVPETFRNDPDAYIEYLINEVLPEVGEKELADYVDIFCETGYFEVYHMERLLKEAAPHGLRPKVHVNQFNSIGGIPSAVRHNALTVDHLEVMQEADYEALEGSSTIAVALPGCSLFLGIPYTPGRELIDRHIPLALATDLNPGSAPSGNMNLVVALACIKMKLTPEEAINAATINGAFAMGLEKSHGSITRGKKASVIITKPMPSIGYLPYAFGSNPIEQVIINGEFIHNH
jgi:imidazolonepropionase